MFFCFTLPVRWRKYSNCSINVALFWSTTYRSSLYVKIPLVRLQLMERTGLCRTEQMHSYVITGAVIMNSDFWFASELQDIFPLLMPEFQGSFPQLVCFPCEAAMLQLTLTSIVGVDDRYSFRKPLTNKCFQELPKTLIHEPRSAGLVKISSCLPAF